MSAAHSHRPPRDRPGARKSGDFTRSLPVVVILTLLIWIYAERAQNRDDSVTAVLSIVASDPNLSAATLDAGDGRVAVSVNGPRGQIDALKTRIESASIDGKLRVTLPAADSSAGDKTLDLTRVLNDAPLFANSGVTVTKTSPAQVRVSVEPVVSRNVTVVVPSDLSVTLLSQNFDPAKIAVRGPASAVNREFNGDSPTIAVNAAQLREAAAGGSRSIDIALTPPVDPLITLGVKQVRMTFEVGSTVLDVTVPSVGILIERPLGDDGKSKVVMKRGPVITNVQLRGPANLVNKYVGDQPETKLQAVLPVTQDDDGKTDLHRDVLFPYRERGVEVVGGPYTVGFDVIDLTP